MSQNPTIPPAPKRPPAIPMKIPSVVEKTGPRSYHIDPYHGINQIRPLEPPKRHPTPSEVDLHVVRHDEQLKGLERRVGGLEEIAKSVDSKLDMICETQAQEKHTRELQESIKEDAKVKEDQKTKRFQALLIAIPLILSPILGFYASYMSKPTPDYKTNTVVVSEYTEEAAKCKNESRSKQEFVTCIRKKQLENTPNFEE